DDRYFSSEIGLVEHRLANHAGNQIDAFLERGRRRVRQIQLVDRLRRAGDGVGVVAQTGSKPLEVRDRLGDPEVFGLPERQVLEKMRSEEHTSELQSR